MVNTWTLRAGTSEESVVSEGQGAETASLTGFVNPALGLTALGISGVGGSEGDGVAWSDVDLLTTWNFGVEAEGAVTSDKGGLGTGWNLLVI